MIAKRDNLTKEEIEQLKKEWLAEIEAEQKANDKELEDLKLSYEEKLKAAQAASNAGLEQESSVPNNLRVDILHIKSILTILHGYDPTDDSSETDENTLASQFDVGSYNYEPTENSFMQEENILESPIVLESFDYDPSGNSIDQEKNTLGSQIVVES